MTPACVASASINSAATKTRGIMERIRIGVGTDNLRFEGGRVSKTGAALTGFPPRSAGARPVFIQPSWAAFYKRERHFCASDGCVSKLS